MRTCLSAFRPRRFLSPGISVLALILPASGVSALRAQAVDTMPRVHLGAYRFATGNLLIVGYESATAIRIRDLDGGMRATLPRTGPARFERDSVRVTFTKQGDAIAAARVDIGASSRTAVRVPLRFETVEWRSDGSRLRGTLVRPPVDGALPLIVAQPGSSWQTRYNEHGMFTALTFAARGFAGFAYDKRGYGESEGEQLVGFEQTASDLAAAVDALKLRFDINPARVVLWGLSQGGWIAPLAATKTDVAGIVLVGAAGTTPARQEILRSEAVLRARGFPPADVEAIRRLQKSAFHYGNTGTGWDEYLRERTAAEGKPWLRWIWAPTEPGPDWWMWGRLNGAYNPLPALLQLRVPLLAQWGEFDLNVDPEVNRAIFEVALDAAGNRDYSLVIVPSADHELEKATDARDAVDDASFAPGVWDAMTRWLVARFGPVSHP